MVTYTCSLLAVRLCNCVKRPSVSMGPAKIVQCSEERFVSPAICMLMLCLVCNLFGDFLVGSL